MAELSTLEVAQQAFDSFTEGLHSGNWQPFLAMVADDITFWFPMGPYGGRNQGKARLAEFLAYVHACFPAGLTLTLDRVTSNETTVVFEFRDEGQLRGEPYKNRVAVSFDVKDGLVCGYREYFGSDGKSN